MVDVVSFLSKLKGDLFSGGLIKSDFFSDNFNGHWKAICDGVGVVELGWLVGVLLLSFYFLGVLKPRRLKRRWRVAKASKIIKKLGAIGVESGPQRQFGYLRSKSVDPFVFEEAILTALKRRKVNILRNERYTGDGGVDGKAWVNGKLVLIQAKLYSGHISAQHVKDFVGLCDKQKSFGLFVHTGRTGALSREVVMSNRNIDIVSGKRVLDLLLGDEITLFKNSLKVHL